MLLAVDTATQYASIAIFDGEQILAELNWRSDRRHTEELAYQVDRLLALVHAKPNELQALGVALGPGSYTGTRVAVSYAKGIVAALGVSLVGIPTLDVLAHTHIGCDAALCAMVEAGRERYCWATYRVGRDDAERTSAWKLGRMSDILSDITPPMRFVGELRLDDVSLLQQSWGDAAITSPHAWSTRRAGVLAVLAWRRCKQGDVDDPATLSPIYLG